MGVWMIRFVLLTVLLFSAAPARGEGALAIGITEDLARGFSAGWGANYATSKEAEEMALKRCLEEPNAPDDIKKRCRIVETFRNRCVSIAIDPMDGETGTGWAIAVTSADADREALAECRKTAGRNRQNACQVTTRGCDGSAN
jgi:hypothetical protein